jgi:hypothetical protein
MPLLAMPDQLRLLLVPAPVELEATLFLLAVRQATLSSTVEP